MIFNYFFGKFSKTQKRIIGVPMALCWLAGLYCIFTKTYNWYGITLIIIALSISIAGLVDLVTDMLGSK